MANGNYPVGHASLFSSIARESGIQLTSEYWDCECEENYINPSNLRMCLICKAVRDDQPNSRVSEVLKHGLPLITVLDQCIEKPMCTCLEKAGDDVNCQVHGSTPPSIPPHQESVDGEES